MEVKLAGRQLWASRQRPSGQLASIHEAGLLITPSLQ